MKKLILFTSLLFLFSSCIQYGRVIDRTPMKTYQTEKSSYGGMTVMHDSDKYYLITFKGPSKIPSGSKIQLSEDLKDCIRWDCNAYLNLNYNSWFKLNVFYITKYEREAYFQFERIIYNINNKPRKGYETR